jgi:hypothetical protein
MWWQLAVAGMMLLGCSGGDEGPQPDFCNYQKDLRAIPAGECDFSGVCKVRVAYYCENPQAATKKKYDCECLERAFSCTLTETGLSIDTTCLPP